jgi:RHS repeat-associated protein
MSGSTPSVVERDSYDAWGKMRNPSTWAYDPTCTLPPASEITRHFTGHESLATACLINANARIYDPQIGRFMSADPVTENPFDLQDLNHYSYVLNNPLSLSDPTGNGGLFKNAAVVFVLQQYEVLPFIASTLGVTTSSATLAGIVNAGISGGIGGAISTGTLKGAGIGAAEAIAFAGVHIVKDDAGFPDNASDYTASQVAESAIAHGAVGGLFSLHQKGGFQSGFLAGAISDLSTTSDSNQLNPVDAIKNAVAGGIGSVLGGGKFQNGAVTGAFGYLFNDQLRSGGGSCGGAAAAAGGACLALGAAAAACPETGVSCVTVPSALAMCAGASAGAGAVCSVANSNSTGGTAFRTHANSASSMQGTELYYLINRTTGDIDKIGITSYPDQRYSQAYLDAENVRYQTQWQFQWRAAAMAAENIELMGYWTSNGRLPRLNQNFH